MTESTHLDRINATTRATIAAAKAAVPLTELERRAALHTPRGFAVALRQRATSGPAIIAEIKKASPSKGLIRADFNPPGLAERYRYGGATCLSVLTDEPYFQGSLAYLEQASAAVPLPCLRKDFMLDPYQMAEARAHHADAILLIVASLPSPELKLLAREARNYDLDILLEVHTADELTRALDDLGPDVAQAIGVNSRNLKTLQVDLAVAFELAAAIPTSSIRVAESGISSPDDLVRLRSAGYDAFLIGESLMRQPDPGEALANLLAGAKATR